MSIRERCDQIVRLIDQALATNAPPVAAPPTLVASGAAR